jgi:hypothetical protein
MEIPRWPPENIEEMAKKLEQEIGLSCTGLAQLILRQRQPGRRGNAPTVDAALPRRTPAEIRKGRPVRGGPFSPMKKRWCRRVQISKICYAN